MARIKYSKEEKFRLVKEALTSDMSIWKWARLNRIPAENLYRWIKKFREEEPGIFDEPATPGGWIELSRSAIKKQSALAVVDEAHDKPRASKAFADEPKDSGFPSIQAEVNGVRLLIPTGVKEKDLSVIFRAARS